MTKNMRIIYDNQILLMKKLDLKFQNYSICKTKVKTNPDVCILNS